MAAAADTESNSAPRAPPHDAHARDWRSSCTAPTTEAITQPGIAVVVAFFLVAAFAPAPPATATQERFTAAAVNTNNGGTGTVELVIERWSTDGERDRLLAALADQGQDKLLDTQKMPRVGYIRMDAWLGYELHYAYQTAGEDGGERVVLATDRPIGFWEAANRPRSIDYPFTVIELRVNGDGDGEGKLSLATRVTVDRSGRNVTLENCDSQPVLLQGVRRERAAR